MRPVLGFVAVTCLVRSSLLSAVSVVFILPGKFSSGFIARSSSPVFTVGVLVCPILISLVNHGEMRSQCCRG